MKPKKITNNKLIVPLLLYLTCTINAVAFDKSSYNIARSDTSSQYVKSLAKLNHFHSQKKKKRKIGKSIVLGYPTHGTNNYYGQFIHDYSKDTNHPLLVNGPWYQVGLFNPSEPREDLPVLGDDLDRVLATTSEMVENFIAPGLYDPLDPIFNKPFNELGTLFFGSQGVYDRVPVVSHEECNPTIREVSFCTREGAIQNPTLRDWNRIRAKLIIKHLSDNTDDITVVVRNGLPKTLFSMWLVGVQDNFEPVPLLTASPLGGIPNVLVTDKTGSAKANISVNYPILKPCERGPGKGCQLYVSLVWHPDGVVFGGAPSIDFITDPTRPDTPGVPVGVVGSAQAFIPLQGQPLFDVRQIYRDNR